MMSRIEAEQIDRDGRILVKDASSRAKGLANTLVVERSYTPDREAMLAALRVALGLPKALPSRQEGWQA